MNKNCEEHESTQHTTGTAWPLELRLVGAGLSVAALRAGEGIAAVMRATTSSRLRVRWAESWQG